MADDNSKDLTTVFDSSQIMGAHASIVLSALNQLDELTELVESDDVAHQHYFYGPLIAEHTPLDFLADGFKHVSDENDLIFNKLCLVFVDRLPHQIVDIARLPPCL